MEKPAATPLPAKKPWPMKWIVLVIIVYVSGYTFINLAYRKPAGSAHEPYVEARERSLRTVQTTMNGWSRLQPGFATTVAGDSFDRAEIAQAPLPHPLDRSLPGDLPMIMPGEPRLHPASIAITAPARVVAADSLMLHLDFPVDATVPAFGEVLAYAKDNHLYLFIQDHHRVAPGTSPTPATPPLAIVLPPTVLTAGVWKASAYTATTAFTWTFIVE